MEAVREMLGRYYDLCREVVERYAGTIEKFIGDAVMAVWGTPQAHEDDAARAVRAALDLVDAARAIRTPTGEHARSFERASSRVRRRPRSAPPRRPSSRATS